MRVTLTAMVLFIGLTAPLACADSTSSQVTIVKTPVSVETRIFDPKKPPPDMPPFTPPETAECDSNFLSDASVACQARQTGPAKGELIVTQIKVTIQLNIVIWLPTNKFQKLEDHENGHRQISETYYKYADGIARRIAEPYIGKHYDISGSDIRKAMSAQLQKIGTDITDEYNRQIPVETTQLRYDAINQHGVNDVPVADAIAQAMKETFPNYPDPTTQPANP